MGSNSYEQSAWKGNEDAEVGISNVTIILILRQVGEWLGGEWVGGWVDGWVGGTAHAHV